jgi:hypothetical protein
VKRGILLAEPIAVSQEVEETAEEKVARLQEAVRAAMAEIAKIKPEAVKPSSLLSQTLSDSGEVSSVYDAASAIGGYYDTSVISQQVSSASVVSQLVSVATVTVDLVTCSHCGRQQYRPANNRCSKWTCRRQLPDDGLSG